MPSTRIDRAIEYGKALIDPPTPYGFWRGAWPPASRPQNPEWMYVEAGAPPNPKNAVPDTNCAGLINLMAAAGGSDFRGGTLIYGERIKNKQAYRPGMRLRRGEVLVSAFRGTGDEGHIVMVLEDGIDPPTIGSDHTDGGTRPGVNTRYRAQRAHQLFDFEFVGVVPGLEPLESDDKEDKPVDREQDRPEKKHPEREQEDREHESREREAVLFTAEQLSAISGNPNLALLKKYRDALVPEMRKGRLDTYKRATAFLAEIVQETDRLKAVEEYASGQAYEWRRDLGNVRQGDGVRFKGRGFIMITGRANYTAASKDLGVDLVSRPTLASRPDVAARVALWFWNKNGCSPYADRGEFKAVSAIINTGSPHGEPNGMTDRLKFYDQAKRVLSKDMSGDTSAAKKGRNHDDLPLANLAAVGQADETLAFALAMEIRKAGIGVTVTNGRANVHALAAKIRDEPMGYRQMWIIGGPALEACGEYGELANWPASSKTDYYNLSGGDFTATCRRAAKLADEKVKEGVGQRFLREMGVTEPDPTRSPSRATRPAQDEEEDRSRHEERIARDRSVAQQRDRDRRSENGHEYGKDAEPDRPEPTEGLADDELEEIGRKVLQLVSGIRGHNGQKKGSRKELEAAHKEQEED